MKVISIAGFMLMLVSVVGLMINLTIFSTTPGLIGVQIAAAALMLWARLTFGRRSFRTAANPTEGGLVTTGPYRFIRHPIYTAVCMFWWAGILSNRSVVSVVFGVGLAIGVFMRMFVEERLLVQRYPDYEQYAQATKRMIPYLF
jgi:protein-S-isoprenylcysteine O-methyltransferase Ste14